MELLVRENAAMFLPRIVLHCGGDGGKKVRE